MATAFDDAVRTRERATREASSPRHSILSRLSFFGARSANVPLAEASGAFKRFSIRRSRHESNSSTKARTPSSSTNPHKLKRSRSARDSVRPRSRPTPRSPARDAGEGSESGGLRDYQRKAALFAMSSPDLATPASELHDWLDLRPSTAAATPDFDPETQAGSTGSNSASERDLTKTPRVPRPRARSPTTHWEPTLLPPSPDTSPQSVAPRRRRSSSPHDAAREANRAEALAKLTTPTPTPTTAGFDENLAGFPFPDIPGEPAKLESAASPSARACAAPMAHHGESVSLILPGASAKASPGGVATPPRLLRANTVVMHPAAVPLDIDLRGRLVRARNLHTGSASPGLTISSTSSSGRDEPLFDLEQSDHSLDSHTPADSLVDHVDGLPRPGMYGNFDKRAVQSAIDVLAVVDEDKPISTAVRLRPRSSLSARQSPQAASPLCSPPRSEERGGEDTPLRLPRVRRTSGRALSSTPPKPLRPYRLSVTDRSFSSGIITEPTVAEREEHGVPTVSAPDLTLTAPSPGLSETGPAGAGPSETRRARKRVLSDPALDTLLPTRQCPGTPIGRTPRRGSLSSVAREGSSEEVSLVDARLTRRSSSGPTVRTKLVVREKGQPVLTYQLGECIGRGQFGSVYRALNLNTGQVVAVKRIALDGRSKDEVAQLSQEVMLLQSLSHPAIVKYEGVVRTEHFLNIILEFVENGSLQRTLKQFGELPEALVASYVDKILEGLIYLHAQGVVHCDLKAANVLSTKNGNVKLSDFGVSLNLHAIKTTRGLAAGANDANGTPNWMAPEVIPLEGATPASDIWSLGATVCELVSGKPPYHDLTSMSAMFRIVEDDFPPLPHGASSRLRDFLRRCFHKKPDGRPSAIALYDDPWLVQFRAEEKPLRPQDSLPFPRAPRPRLQNSLERDGPETSAAKKPHPLSEAPVTDAPFCDSPRPTLELQDQSFEIEAAAEHSRPHDFVKITSSKAVKCRLCGEQTKRHAVLCKYCGLISHSRCREFAPGCDLHAQLTLQRIPTLPSRPQSGESTFSLADYNPFGRNRRSRQSSHRSSGEFSTAASQSISPIRALSGVLHPHGKQRSPASSPPTSLGKAAAVAGPRRSLSPPPKQRKDTPATPTRPPLVRSPRISIDEPRVPLRQAAFAAADGEHATRASPIRDPSRRRTFSAQYSHGRSVSQPSFPVPENSAKRSDCRAM